jgi:hypothetical protein
MGNTPSSTNISTRLKDDKEVVMAAVTQNGWALKCASPELKDNIEVVMAAVTQNTDRLKNDKEVLLATVKQEDVALQFASEGLKIDEDVLMAAGRLKEYEQKKNMENYPIHQLRKKKKKHIVILHLLMIVHLSLLFQHWRMTVIAI